MNNQMLRRSWGRATVRYHLHAGEPVEHLKLISYMAHSNANPKIQSRPIRSSISTLLKLSWLRRKITTRIENFERFSLAESIIFYFFYDFDLCCMYNVPLLFWFPLCYFDPPELWINYFWWFWLIVSVNFPYVVSTLLKLINYLQFVNFYKFILDLHLVWFWFFDIYNLKFLQSWRKTIVS